MGRLGEIRRQVMKTFWYSSAIVLERYYRQKIERLPMSLNTTARPHPVIITLTTTPRRLFQKTDLTIATLLGQNFRPDRVILWLSDEVKGQNLPESFRKLQDAGLEVQYRRDVGPHTKLLYALAEFPDSVIFSVDDDFFYPPNLLGNLYAAYQRAPQNIHCHSAHLIRRDGSGKLLPYAQWGILAPGVVGPSHLLFPLGAGGVLYPPHSLDEEVFQVEKFQQLCPLADDVWFKAMALLKGTLAQKMKPRDRRHVEVNGSQEVALFHTNITRNDAQLRATFDAYDLYQYLEP